ncbi:TIGR03773 family transporter-associated surface protein [Actinoplanes sp. DH11]|uniref:TIGR03773 family transporter-associated surface protein n=1 Tax=Actinoplanes sp. DH11 TaxID=2857011 RepID=UPI001E51D670|nr:TIGR03773 family transporter-associated surface protein [Actinoplanes sp. DH11]
MTRRRRLDLRRTVAVATTSLAMTLVGGTPAVAATPADGADLLALSVESGDLRMSFRSLGQTGTDPQSVRFTASGSPVGVVPDDPAFAFLGKPGAPVWSLQEGSPFSTFDTTAITDGELALDLASVDGPGSFAAYTLSEWGRPTLLLDSDGRKGTRLAAGQRLGGVVWLFDAAGEYRVTLRATARIGARTLRDEAVYSVSVPVQTRALTPQRTTPAEQAAPAVTKTAGTTKAADVAAAPKVTAAAGGKKVISDGHVDMGPQLSGGALAIKIKDDSTTPATWRELADVTLKVTEKAVIDVPSGAGYAFLGKAGDKVYLLPQSQQSGIVWPGWNTQHESVVKGTKGDVTWRLKQVSGPGDFKLFLTGSFGTPEVVFDSAKTLPQQLRIAPNTHAHGNWAFTEAGLYKLTVDMTATTTAGKSVSDTKTLTLAVGDSTDTGDGKDSTGDGKDGSGDGKEGSGDGGGSGGTGSGDGASTGDDSGDGRLAKTGMNVVSIAGGGVALLVAGAVTVVLARRRRGETDHVSTPEPS